MFGFGIEAMALVACPPGYRGHAIIPRGRSRSQYPAPQSPAQPNENKRNPIFREKLLCRDGACVISQHDRDLQGSHIVAFAYWKEQKRSILPQSVRDVISDLTGNIDSERNGLLLCPNLEKSI